MHTGAAFYLQLTSDDNVTDVSFNRHLITSKSLSDVTGDAHHYITYSIMYAGVAWIFFFGGGV